MNAVHPEVEAFMIQGTLGDTTLTPMDLYKLGEGFLNLVASAQMLGWKSPAGTLDYTPDSPHLWTRFPRDFVAWTSGRKSLAPNCEERMRQWIFDSGWSRFALESVAEKLGGQS